MNPTPQKFYTASQIAQALGRHRQPMARSLADVPADGSLIVAGANVRAWSFAALPVVLQGELEQAAQHHHFRNALALLENKTVNAAWQPPVPLAQIVQGTLDRAAKLQRALERSLAHRDDPTLTAGDLEKMGLEDYAREFGHAISGRHLRSLVSRTVDRDRGSLNFSRLELYLPENPAHKAAPKPKLTLAIESEFQALNDVIAAFKNPASPAPDEKTYLWLVALEIYEERLAAGRAPKKVKRGLLKFLERHASFLVAADAVSVANSLRVNFQNKYSRWIKENRDAKALTDARAENSGRWRGPELSSADRDKLIAHAVFNYGGRVAQAWREMVQRNELSEQLQSYYLSNPASKSYVPHRIEQAVKYEVAMLYDQHHVPRQAKLNGAHLYRDWSRVHAMDWWQGDDFTYPVYFKTFDENGELTLTRGQTVLMIDLRSTRILGFVLIPERQYTANAIRTLITNVADVYGLPRKGFYFEHGTWKAKLLTGESDREALSWPETQKGLREFGLEFRHANLPRAKPVERVGGALQNIMEGLPAYVGRNEMVEKFERTQRMLAAARKGDTAALAQIMDHAEWVEVLAKLCEIYNADRQDGKMTGGLSPDDAFEKFVNLADPPVQFPSHCRYLLAHQRRAIRVTENGITFKLNKETFNFRNTETSKLRGQTVLTWFNPDSEILTVTDMNRQNPFTIARTQSLSPLDAAAEKLAQEMERVAQHQSYPKARYKILKPLKPLAFRGMLADRDTVELGKQIGAQRSEMLDVMNQETRQEKKGRRAAGRLGITLDQTRLQRPETAPALERLAELLADESDNQKGTL